MTDSHWLADLKASIARGAATEAQELLGSASDNEIRDAYLTTDSGPGDPLVDILEAAIQQRGIDL